VEDANKVEEEKEGPAAHGFYIGRKEAAEDVEAPPASNGWYLSGNAPAEDVSEPTNKVRIRSGWWW